MGSTWFKFGFRLPILALSVLVQTKYSDEQLSRSRDLQPGQSRWTPFIWKLVFLPYCSCSVATGQLLFCERTLTPPWPRSRGVQSPKSFPERRKDLANPPPLDPFHRFLLRGVSWQFDIITLFWISLFFPLWLRIFYLNQQHDNDTYWWPLVVYFFSIQFLIRTKLLQCISSAAL